MKLKHFLGIYKDMEAVETAFPSGGREGDYLIVDNDLKGWNQYSNTWVTPTVDEKASVRKTEQVYGDLDVHNNLRVGGKVSAKLIRGRNSFLGLFDSEEKLRLLFPDPSVGEWAMVFAYTTTPTPEEVSSVEEVSPSEQVEQETESNAETSSNSETRRSTDEICVGYIFICEEAGTWKNTGYKGGYQHGLFEAIQDVQDNVDAEAQAREQAVLDEATAREQADATLLGNVGEGDPASIAEETAAREQAVLDEASAREQADEALQTQIKLYTVNNNPSDNQLWIDHSEAPDFVLSTACSIKVRFMNGVPANETITLNINNTGEKPLYVNGVPAKRGSWINGDILEIFYDGTRYQAFDTRVYDEGVFDISVYKASSYGELMEFASLNDAITEPSMIPASMQKAGVTVRFVNSSTHRYEWWRHKGLSFSLDATEWEKIIDKNYVDSVAASLQNNIDLEAAARHQEVLAEAAAREQAVSAEATARQQADTNLQENIDTEASTRQQAVAGERAAREQAVAAEATARQQAVSAEATARQQAVTAEKNRAQSAEGELSTAINTEKNRAQGIESNLQQAIESEHDRATVIEGNLSTAISSEVTRATSAEGLLGGRVGNIEGMIPSQASSSNQLADKNFTNSSIATSTATHRGSFNLVSDLGLSVSATQEQIANRIASKLVELGVDADKNDYVFVLIPNEAASPNEILRVERYKHNGTNWGFEFTLNNSSFTSDQWAAINSAITSGLVEKLQALPNNTELTTLLGGKADKAVNAVAGNVAVFNASGNPVDSGTNVAVIYTDGVYDVSAKNGGATFASLSALLSNANLNTLIPTDVRRGGMSIRFIQSSDNKYVQYFLNAQTFTTDVSAWEKMNLEEEVSQLSKDTFGVSRVMRYGVFVSDTSKLAASADNTKVFWWKSNQKINRVGGVFVYGVGISNTVEIYKVTENTEDKTASFELLITASGENKESLYIPLNIELGENEYIGQSGIQLAYYVAKADTDYTFTSWSCSKSAQDSAIVENQNYFPVIGLVCSTIPPTNIKDMEQLLVYEAGFPYPSMSDIVISGDGANLYWFDDVPVNNIAGLSFIGGNGNANFYKVTVNKSNNTASYELLKSVFAGFKELKTISLSVELADNQFIGIGGVLSAYNMGSADVPFASKYIKLSDGQNANIKKGQYGVMMHLLYNKLQTLPLVQPQTPTYVSGKKVLLYGDSITNGYIPGGTHGTFYEDFIFQKIKASSVVKRGFDSACCAQKSGWNNYLSDNTRLQDVITQSPDVLLMLIGTNDYQLGNPIGAIGDGDLTTFLGALTHIITTIMQALPNCVIILCTPTPYYYPMATGGQNYESGRENNSAGKNIRDYADAIIALANQYSIPICDINAKAGWLDINEATRNFTTDGLHLSQKGYDRITSIQAGFYKIMFSI